MQTVAAMYAGSVAKVKETLTRLGELDQMFMDDNLDPAEYVRLSKNHRQDRERLQA